MDLLVVKEYHNLVLIFQLKYKRSTSYSSTFYAIYAKKKTQKKAVEDATVSNNIEMLTVFIYAK